MAVGYESDNDDDEKGRRCNNTAMIEVKTTAAAI
jgi:hypothetical protein